MEYDFFVCKNNTDLLAMIANDSNSYVGIGYIRIVYYRFLTWLADQRLWNAISIKRNREKRRKNFYSYKTIQICYWIPLVEIFEVKVDEICLNFFFSKNRSEENQFRVDLRLFGKPWTGNTISFFDQYGFPTFDHRASLNVRLLKVLIPKLFPTASIPQI